MDSIKSKVSYLSGLVDGLGINLESKEGKIIKELIYILDDIADDIEEVKDVQNDIQDYIDNMDEDLTLLEGEIYEDDEECDCGCDDIENFVDFKCPNCGEKVYIDTEILNKKEDVVCPNCHEDIPLKLDCGCNCSSCNDCGEYND